jgi:Glycosyl transferase family 2
MAHTIDGRPYLRSMATITVIVPAHNEASVIGRLLDRLTAPAAPDVLDVIVVPNGCTDDTAAVAQAYGPPVRVISIPEPSKRAALLAGDAAATSFPRIYVDGDVELGVSDIRALARALERPGVLAAGPQRVLPMDGRPWLVRWYYDAWSRLPEVQAGLFGRGVVAVSEDGHQRLASLPPLQADDLAASLSFSGPERAIVSGAHAVIQPPRTVQDLLRRRIRVATGVAQVGLTEGAPQSTARTRPAELVKIAVREPAMAPKLAAFAGMALMAQRGARRAVRRGDYTTWLRDESTRRPQITRD